MLHYTFVATICWLSHVLIKWHTCRNPKPETLCRNHALSCFHLPCWSTFLYNISCKVTAPSSMPVSPKDTDQKKIHCFVAYGMYNLYLWDRKKYLCPVIQLFSFSSSSKKYVHLGSAKHAHDSHSYLWAVAKWISRLGFPSLLGLLH